MLGTMLKNARKTARRVRALAAAATKSPTRCSPGAEARRSGPTSIIETFKLGKLFGHFAANRDIDFQVDPGELRAVIGPNGAGKTTFFNLLSGTIAPTERHDQLQGPRRQPRERHGARAPRDRQSVPDREPLPRPDGAAELPPRGARARAGTVRAAGLPPLDAAGRRRRARRARDRAARARPASPTCAPAISRTATRSGSTSRSRSRRSRRSCCSTNPSPACRRTKRARPKR